MLHDRHPLYQAAGRLQVALQRLDVVDGLQDHVQLGDVFFLRDGRDDPFEAPVGLERVVVSLLAGTAEAVVVVAAAAAVAAAAQTVLPEHSLRVLLRGRNLDDHGDDEDD